MTDIKLKDRIKDFPHEAYKVYGQASLKGMKQELELSRKCPKPTAFWPIVQVLKIMKLESTDKMIILDARGKRELEARTGLHTSTVSTVLNFLKKEGALVSLIKDESGSLEIKKSAEYILRKILESK